jgi:hypothetical protein
MTHLERPADVVELDHPAVRRRNEHVLVGNDRGRLPSACAVDPKSSGIGIGIDVDTRVQVHRDAVLVLGLLVLARP